MSSPQFPDSPPISPSSSGSQSTFVADAHDVIPPTFPARTLVLCFDGTGDQFDSDNSNVVQLFSMLKKDDRNQQMVYYQAGIGTYTTPQVATPMMAKLSKTLDEMIAWNLDAHVMGGYEFLMQNYQGGDKICIFGFSRGAYTARALAGMIHKVGLIPACNHQQVPFAYKMYTRTDELGWKQSTAFKKAFSIDVDIEFLGVWDTVASVGLIPRRLPFTSSNTALHYFRHAVALDERRAKFKANLYNRPTEDEALLGTQPGDMPKSSVPPIGQGVPVTIEAQDGQKIGEGVVLEDAIIMEGQKAAHGTVDNAAPTGKRKSDSAVPTGDARSSNGKGTGHKAKRPKQSVFERQFSQQDSINLETDVLEVWFAGCHCDVGGGSVSNETSHNLARIPLRWMIRQCFKCNTGIRFHAESLRAVGLDPAALYPCVLPRPPALYELPPGFTETRPEDALSLHSRQISSETIVEGAKRTSGVEEIEDLLDAQCPIYDQLSIAPWWWILELLPMKQRYQKSDKRWAKDLTINLGHPRIIPYQHKRGFKVHRSVDIRMKMADLPGGPYIPRPLWKVQPQWADIDED